MFCRNCGNQLPDGSTVCYQCGASQLEGQQQATPQQGYAPQGYVQQPPQNYVNPAMCKSKLVAILLALFLGGWGVHDFYLGYTTNGVIKIILCIFTLGLASGIWALIDLIRIAIGSIDKDARGLPLV